jgi:hypothetical protein
MVRQDRVYMNCVKNAIYSYNGKNITEKNDVFRNCSYL